MDIRWLRWIVFTSLLFSLTGSMDMEFSDDVKQLMKMLHDTCVEETGVTEDLIDKVNKEKVFADVDSLKCYVFCLMSEVGCISDDGIIDEDAAIAILPDQYQARAEPTIRSCGTKKGKDRCENAWLTHQCYLKTDPDSYILI